MTEEEKDEEKRKEALRKAFDIYGSFQSDFDYTQRHTMSYAQRMWDIMETETVTYRDLLNDKMVTTFIRDRGHFNQVTGLGPSTFDRIKGEAKKGEEGNYIPGIVTFMTLCMVYRLSITMVKELRLSYGYDFNPRNRTHQAYVYLLVNCRGKSLSYCNKVLKSLGIEKKYYLGDGTIVEKAVTQEVLAEIQ